MQPGILRIGLKSVEEAVVAASTMKRLVEAAGTPVVVTAHRNADPDAVASALVVRWLLRSEGFDARLVLPEGVSLPSKRMIEQLLGADYSVEDGLPAETRLVVVVDTASPSQLGVLADLVNNTPLLVVVDHHSSSMLVEKATLSIYDPSAKATAELVYTLAVYGFKKQLPRRELELLLAGIIYDSRHFLLATPKTLRIAAEIMEQGASLEDVLNALQSPPMTVPEKIARLKAAKRMHVIRAGEYLTVITRVGAYESSVAKSLLDLGADVVIIVSERGLETRIVGRSKKDIVDGLGLHLGRDVMEKAAQMLGGSGGGHSQAAGAAVNAPLEKTLSVLISIVNEFFKSRGLNPQPLA